MAHVYATLAQCSGEFKALTLSATSTPTSTQVDDWIDEEEASAEASVGMKYTVPIDSTASPKAFKIMRKTVIELVAGRIKNTIAVKSGSTDANQGKISDGDTMIKRATDRLKAIRDGDIILADATLVSSNDGVRSFNVDNEDSVTDDIDDAQDQIDGSDGAALNAGNSVPTFQRGKRSW